MGDELLRAWLCDKSRATLRNYRADLEDYRRFCGASTAAIAVALLVSMPHGEANQQALAYKGHLLERPVWRSAHARDAGREPDRMGVAPSTVNRRLAALRSVCSLARRFGYMTWKLEVDSMRVTPYRDTKGVHRDDVKALLAHLGDEAERAGAEADGLTRALALRDVCIVRFLMDHALRREELVTLTWPGDIDLRHNRMWLLGKGSEHETQKDEFPLSAPALEALHAWLRERGDQQGPLFGSASNRALGQRLTVRGLNKVLVRIAAAAGCGHIRPHMFRHAAITRALDKTGGDVRAVQRFSRLASVETVMIYDDRREDKPRQVVDLVAEEDDDDADD